jgi:hypothetical protein
VITEYSAEYAPMLLEHMSEGYDLISFGAVIGTSAEVLKGWLTENDDFKEAFDLGETKAAFFWQELGIRGTKGQMKGYNQKTWEFVMKNRFGWTDKKDSGPALGGNTINCQIYLPSNERGDNPGAPIDVKATPIEVKIPMQLTGEKQSE